MARSRCEIATAERSRSAGSRIIVTVDADRSETIALIQELAGRIGMRATLTPSDRRDTEADR